MSGIVGIVREGYRPAAPLLLYGLFALQHRGQETAGMATLNHNHLSMKKGTGLLSSIFVDDSVHALAGDRGLGHVKYGEYRRYDKEQPILPKEFNIKGIHCLLSLDGNILNPGFSLGEMTDKLGRNPEEALAYLDTLQGAFAGIYMNPHKMVGFRDPWGLKPLCVGRVDEGFIFASETCAIDSCGGTLIKMLDIGEAAIVTGGRLTFHKYSTRDFHRSCLMEMVYVSRPDSYMDGVSVYNARNEMGRLLYHEHPSTADIVMGAPDSGLTAAVGYAEASKIPYKDGIIKNRYIGRTFINPDEHMRSKDLYIKLNPIREVLEGKRIIVVDDSIVRGSTIKRTIRMLRGAGAKEVHVRISSPMLKHCCQLSLDLPFSEELMAYKKDVEEIRQEIGADSLYYLSLEGLKTASRGTNYCDMCFTTQSPFREEAVQYE